MTVKQMRPLLCFTGMEVFSLALRCTKCKTLVPQKAILSEAGRVFNKRRRVTGNAGRKRKRYRCKECGEKVEGYEALMSHRRDCKKQTV